MQCAIVWHAQMKLVRVWGLYPSRCHEVWTEWWLLYENKRYRDGFTWSDSCWPIPSRKDAAAHETALISGF